MFISIDRGFDINSRLKILLWAAASAATVIATAAAAAAAVAAAVATASAPAELDCFWLGLIVLIVVDWFDCF